MEASCVTSLHYIIMVHIEVTQRNNLLSLNIFIRSPVHEGPQQLHLSQQLCQPEVDVLVVQERGTKCLSLSDIVNSLVDDVDHGCEAHSTGSKPLLLELDHLVGETHA